VRNGWPLRITRDFLAGLCMVQPSALVLCCSGEIASNKPCLAKIRAGKVSVIESYIRHDAAHKRGKSKTGMFQADTVETGAAQPRLVESRVTEVYLVQRLVFEVSSVKDRSVEASTAQFSLSKIGPGEISMAKGCTLKYCSRQVRPLQIRRPQVDSTQIQAAKIPIPQVRSRTL